MHVFKRTDLKNIYSHHAQNTAFKIWESASFPLTQNALMRSFWCHYDNVCMILTVHVSKREWGSLFIRHTEQWASYRQTSQGTIIRITLTPTDRRTWRTGGLWRVVVVGAAQLWRIGPGATCLLMFPGAWHKTQHVIVITHSFIKPEDILNYRNKNASFSINHNLYNDNYLHWYIDLLIGDWI